MKINKLYWHLLGNESTVPTELMLIQSHRNPGLILMSGRGYYIGCAYGATKDSNSELLYLRQAGVTLILMAIWRRPVPIFSGAARGSGKDGF